MKRNRYEEIDWIRAFLVVLVVLGHALENGSNIVSMTPVKQFLYDWIYSFHMPLFMSLSGFVMSKYIYDINGGGGGT